jgi:hypothetical protein
MSNLALLAFNARTAAPVFNGTFYATVATIIPVLFLAIAIQGNIYQAILLEYARRTRAYRQRMRAADAAGQLTIRKALGGGLAAQVPGILASAILVGGLYGEGVALDALYVQKAPPGAGLIVLLVTLYLVAVATSGPMGQYVRLVRHERADLRREARAERLPQAEGGSGEPGAPPEPIPAPQAENSETSTA